MLPHYDFTLLEKGKQDPRYGNFINGQLLGILTSCKTDFARLLHRYLSDFVLAFSTRLSSSLPKS